MALLLQALKQAAAVPQVCCPLTDDSGWQLLRVPNKDQVLQELLAAGLLLAAAVILWATCSG